MTEAGKTFLDFKTWTEKPSKIFYFKAKRTLSMQRDIFDLSSLFVD